MLLVTKFPLLDNVFMQLYDGIMHPLDGAYNRVKRAEEHLKDLDSQVRILSKAISDGIVVNSNRQSSYKPGDILGIFKINLPQVPYIISILVGEIVYNLRSALDYLVYELACLDSGTIQNGTQFPIEDTINGFSGRCRSYLKGVSSKHAAIIKSLQPYNGCDWTKSIRDLSNPDKHRKLTIAKTSTDYTIPILNPSAKKDSPNNMNSSAVVHVEFRAGTSIVSVDTLNLLKAQVTETLNIFYPEFK